MPWNILPRVKAFGGLVVQSWLLSIPIPEVEEGLHCSGNMGEIAKNLGITKVLVVTDKILVGLGLLDRALVCMFLIPRVVVR